MQKIQHIIVISLENHSFDNLFGAFPGADGLAQARDTALQTDAAGKPYEVLPRVMNTEKKPAAIDRRFPADLPNRPFPIEKYVPLDDKTGDLAHEFYEQQAQIHGGKMDRFAAVSDAGGLVMGYYDGSPLGLWKYAQKYTLADHFFHAAFGGSFLNHLWMICACTPRYAAAPENLLVRRDKQGNVVHSGVVTEDGYAVNTILPFYGPHHKHTAEEKLLPPQSMPTIGDRLSEKGISWAWYAGGWDAAVAKQPAASFQLQHQPFLYFKRFAAEEERGKYLKDEKDFLDDIAKGALPAVAFYKPLGDFNLHPGSTDLVSGDRHITRILDAIEKSPEWESSVVIVTFDENGGFWDHVPPPVIDRFGPGVRVPTIIISPLVKKGFVDHSIYDTTSILKLIEERYGLKPLGTRDAQAGDLGKLFIKQSSPAPH